VSVFKVPKLGSSEGLEYLFKACQYIASLLYQVHKRGLSVLPNVTLGPIASFLAVVGSFFLYLSMCCVISALSYQQILDGKMEPEGGSRPPQFTSIYTTYSIA
jgi:hypothetical protein